MRPVCILLAAGVLAGAPAQAAEPSREVVTQPDWLRRPSAEDMGNFYPKLASSLDVEGRATISCDVTFEGKLTNCTVVSQAPPDFGFGAAAVGMASVFQMRPMTKDGKPVDGGIVRIPIMFRLPQGDEAASGLPPPPAAPSPESLVIARQLADDMGLVETGVEGLKKAAETLQSKTDAGVPEALPKLAAQVAREVAESHRNDLRDAIARDLAAVYADGEMTALGGYMRGAGALMRSKAHQAFLRDIQSRHLNRIRSGASATFCAAHPCVTPETEKAFFTRGGPSSPAPKWAAEPPPKLIASRRPVIAASLGLEGLVKLSCRGAAEGALRDCEAKAELPEGLGFGAAAERLASSYRTKAATPMRKVEFVVRFPPPEPAKTDTAGPLPEPRSPDAVQLARAMETAGGPAKAKLDLELRILELTEKSKTAHPAVLESALTAFREAALASSDIFYDERAKLLAGMLSDAQIEEAVAFQKTPLGRAQVERSRALTVLLNRTLARIRPVISEDVRKGVCAVYKCEADLPTPSPR